MGQTDSGSKPGEACFTRSGSNTVTVGRGDCLRANNLAADRLRAGE